jgi:tripartite-type tricarboxylate transporter receptor subunit TctC
MLFSVHQKSFKPVNFNRLSLRHCPLNHWRLSKVSIGRKDMFTKIISLATIFACSLGVTARAQDFYAGKVITITTFVAPGGSYDSLMRLLVQHMPRRIPGKPTMIAQNQLGAGGLVAVNHAGKLAPRDGTFLTMPSQGMPMFEVTGQPGMQASLRDFRWIGNMSKSNNVTVAWHASGLRTIEDAKKAEHSVGASGAGSMSAQFPVAANALLGTKFKVIAGYEGGAAMNLAMQRGEVDARAMDTWAGYKVSFPQELKDGRIIPLLQIGLEKEPDLPNVPLFHELVRNDPEKYAIAMFITSSLTLSRPVAAPPGTPADRVEILRRAFDATVADADFLADAQRQGLDISPMRGEDVQQIISQILDTPRDIVQKAQAVLESGAAR